MFIFPPWDVIYIQHSYLIVCDLYPVGEVVIGLCNLALFFWGGYYELVFARLGRLIGHSLLLVFTSAFYDSGIVFEDLSACCYSSLYLDGVFGQFLCLAGTLC